MKKVAIFVEGMTEQKFVIKLLTEWFNSLGIQVQQAKRLSHTISMQTVITPTSTLDAFVLVVDCSGDEQVMTQMREQYQTLINANYTALFGLRDVYPKTHAEVSRLRFGLQRSLPQGPLIAQIHLAEMEVEAWFIAESSHFARIHPKLTLKRIAKGGFALDVPCESWPNPAQTLHQIYQLEGLAYKKRTRQVERTIAALSLTEIAISVLPAVPAFREFVDAIGIAVS